jgi:thiol-disulfide isomerase/thioredoxin
MNKIIELEADNLEHYMSKSDLIVVYKSDGCGSCKTIIPHLHKLDETYTIVLVDVVKHPKSCRFMPGKIQHYPTIGLFDCGYYIKELTQFDIINQTIKEL